MNVLNPAQDKVGRTVAAATRQASVLPGVAECTEESDVPGIQIILLVPGGLTSDRDKVTSALPGQCVLVIECIVSENLGIGTGPDIARVVTDVLPSEADIFLGTERNANFLVSGQTEEAGGIAGHTIVPAHTGKSKTRLVHDRGRERVYPTGAGYLRGIVVVRWEEDRKNGAGEVFAGTLRIEPVEFVRISQIVVDLKVFLVVLNETTLRADVVILDQSVKRRSVGGRIDLRVGSEVLGNRIDHRNLISKVRCKVILRVVELSAKGREISREHGRSENAGLL